MNWTDVGGRSMVKHVVVAENSGVFIHVLCKQHIRHVNSVKRKKPLHHCLKCIDTLSKLITSSND